MGQILQTDKIGTLSQSTGTITLTASSSVPSYLTIGGQQYQITANLTRTIATDVTLTLQNLYMVYAVLSGGVVVLRVSTNLNSVGPAGFTSWKLVGAFYTDTAAAFNAFVSKTSATASTFVRLITGSALTYNTPPQTIALNILAIGGGGSGAGGGANDGGAGTAGNSSTFGSSLITASGGGGAPNNFTGGVGGSFTVSAPAVDTGSNRGAAGGTGLAIFAPNTNSIFSGSTGGGPGGGTGGEVGAGTNGTANTGGGGGGGGIAGAGGGYWTPGVAGGSGGIVKALISSPTSSYLYTVAAAQTTVGSAGSGTTGAGGQGGSGLIVIEEIKPNLQQLGDL